MRLQLPARAPEILTLPAGGHFAGTLVVTAFRQKDVTDFASLLYEAKIQAGLLRSSVSTGTFKP